MEIIKGIIFILGFTYILIIYPAIEIYIYRKYKKEIHELEKKIK